MIRALIVLLAVGLAGCGRLTDSEGVRGKVLEVEAYYSPSDVRGVRYEYKLSTSADDSIYTHFNSRKKHAIGEVFCFAYDGWGNAAHEIWCPLFLKPWPKAVAR